jgi:hypothetical protein
MWGEFFMIMQLAYISRAVRLMEPSALVEILMQAREINAFESITGMLLYKDQSFVQILEGHVNALNRVFTRIETDSRHTDVKLLYFSPLLARDFPDWLMGFQNLDDPDFVPPDGYTTFMTPNFQLEEFMQEPSRARQLMLLFRAKS